MKTVKIKIEANVPFHPYKSKELNKKAESFVRRYILETLRNQCSFIRLYIEKDEDGSDLEDSTNQATYKIC